MIYLDPHQLSNLKNVCKELFDEEQLRCACGQIVGELRGWVSKEYIGVGASDFCSCGRGRLSVATNRYFQGIDLLKIINSNTPAPHYET